MLNLQYDNLQLSDLLPILKDIGLESFVDKDGDVIVKSELIKIITKSELKNSIKIYCFLKIDKVDQDDNTLRRFASKLTEIANVAKFSLFLKEDLMDERRLYCEVNLPAVGNVDEAFLKEFIKRSLEDFDKAKQYSKFIDDIVIDSKD
jgi:hypothetical protein